MAELNIKLRTPSRKLLILTWTLIATGVVLGLLAIVIFRPSGKTSLLPRDTLTKINAFTPYFYKGKIPAGYALDKSNVKYASDILIIKLTKADSPDITITQQTLPAGLNQNSLLDRGDKFTSLAGPATINSVEGRMLVSVVSTGKPQTLILINSTGEAAKSDMTAFGQALQAQR